MVLNMAIFWYLILDFRGVILEKVNFVGGTQILYRTASWDTSIPFGFPSIHAISGNVSPPAIQPTSSSRGYGPCAPPGLNTFATIGRKGVVPCRMVDSNVIFQHFRSLDGIKSSKKLKLVKHFIVGF